MNSRYSIRLKRLTAALYLAVVGWLGAPVHVLGAEGCEWVFHQTHFNNGKNRIYLAANAVKIVSESGGFQILAKAPTWQIAIFRPDDKTVYFANMQEFRRFSPFGPLANASPQRMLRLNKVSQGKENSFAITTYETAEPFRRFYLADGPVSPQGIEIARIYYHILDGSAEPGIPLRYVTHVGTSKRRENGWPTAEEEFTGQNVGWLQTESWAKTAFASSDFQYPKGYRNVKTMSEILVSDANKKDLNLLIEGLGIGRKQF